MARPKNPNTPKFNQSVCIVCKTTFVQPRNRSQRKTCGDECYAATRPKFDMHLQDIKKMKRERRAYLRQNYETPIRNVVGV